ncbi:MAG TPA: ABC transporter permease [Anaerolineae bacterium]|nr:ABC transporter permease [Anaerolineae bacterium]
MIAYFIRRLLQSILVIIGVSVIVFVITRAIGDPARMMLPLEASAEEVEAFRDRMGFNDPLWVQFWDWAKNAVKGDFGDSLWQRTDAMHLVLERMPATLLLCSTAIVLAVVASVPLGILAALKPRSWLDKATTSFSLIGVCIPDFWLGLMLILVFAVTLRVVFTSGYGTWRHLVLPAIALAARPWGRITQIVRTSMMDEMHRTYMVTARAKGLAEHNVILSHALKNASIPIVTLAAWELTRMLAGYTIVVETVFAWPGFGQLAMQAIERRDLTLIQADVFVVAIIVVVMNIFIDLIYAMLDPRVRLA